MEIDLPELVQCLKREDNSCLKRFFLEHGKYCLNKLIRKTNCSQEDAEDLFVDAIINFREKLLSEKILHLSNIRAYLYSTCYNMWLVKYRKDQILESRAQEIADFYYETGLSAEEREELLDVIQKAISTMGDKCQHIIKLFYLSKMNMTEIAKEMNFSNAGVAKSTKSRCYKKLVDAVKEQLSENTIHAIS